MSKIAFNKIAAGLEDAIAYADGDATRGRVAVTPDVRAIRAKTKLSQAKFAETFDIPVGTVRDWEQERRAPDAPARTLLKLIETDADAVRTIMASTRTSYSGVSKSVEQKSGKTGSFATKATGIASGKERTVIKSAASSALSQSKPSRVKTGGRKIVSNSDINALFDD